MPALVNPVGNPRQRHFDRGNPEKEHMRAESSTAWSRTRRSTPLGLKALGTPVARLRGLGRKLSHAPEIVRLFYHVRCSGSSTASAVADVQRLVVDE